MRISFNPQDKAILDEVIEFADARKIKLYIVGGYLRDIILNRRKVNPDIDFCINSKAINFGRALAKKLKAGFVVLDKEHGACRIVKNTKTKTYTLDFTDFKGRTLQDDLAHRDFTINTLIVELGTDALIDKHGALKDLKAKTIRVVNKRAFDDDPLRILRAFSFSAMLRFKIDNATLKLAQLRRKKLADVSFERVRDELFKIFDSSSTFETLSQLDKLKILTVILPEIEPMRGVNQGPYHHLDIWMHSLESVRQLEMLLEKVTDNKDIQHYLDEVISSDRRRRALIKLGALLHDIGKPKAMRRREGKLIFHGHERVGADISEGIAKRLKLSNDEWNALRKMIFWHLRPGFMADNEPVSERAKFRYFRDAQNEAVSTLLVSLADQRSTRGRLTTRKSREQHERVVAVLLKEFFAKQKEHKPEKLINGNDLIKELKLQPSPLIGKILRELEELQAIGKIKTKEEAFKAAEKLADRKTGP